MLRSEARGASAHRPKESTMRALEGICPRCNERGAIGHTCPSEGCAGHDVHLVPERYLPRSGLRDKRLGQLVGPWLLVTRKKHYDAPLVYGVLHQPTMLEGELVLVDPERARDTRDHLLRQALAMARVWHPNVQRLVDFGEDEHGTWLVVDVRGAPHTLADLMTSDAEGSRARAWPGSEGLRRLAPTEALALLDPLAAALEALADAKLVHGQLRPEHVLIYDVPGARGHVVLAGFARVPAHDGDAPSPGPRERVYQAPELIGTHTVGATTDLYSLAAVAFELLAGRPPFEPAALKDERGPDLAAVRHWPDATLTFFRRALAWAPSHRYGDAISLREALVAAIAALAPEAAAPERAAASERAAAPESADDEGVRVPTTVVRPSARGPRAPPPPVEPLVEVAHGLELPEDEDALDPWRWTERNKRAGSSAPPTADEDEGAVARKGSGTQIMSTDELEAAELRARSVPRMHGRPQTPQTHRH